MQPLDLVVALPIMHYSSAVEIPENMSFEVAAMTEPASCCFSGTEMIDYKKRPKILIFGAGIMGIFCQLFLMKSSPISMIFMSSVSTRVFSCA